MLREPWQPSDVNAASGEEIYAVTGATGGIGYHIAEGLARSGARVVILGRADDRLRAAADAVRAEVPRADIQVHRLDLSDADSVRSTGEWLVRLGRLDGLVHNAAISDPGRRRHTTRQGFELAMGTNHVGHFLLTAVAWPVLQETRGSRIVPIGSMQTRRAAFDLDDLANEKGYRPGRAYTQSKHAIQAFGFELDRRLRKMRTTSSCVVAHPGLALDGASPVRPGVNEPSAGARFAARLLSPLAQGKHLAARSAMRAVLDPSLRGGEYIGPERGAKGPPLAVEPPPVDVDPATGRRVWEWTAERAGLDFALETPRRTS